MFANELKNNQYFTKIMCGIDIKIIKAFLLDLYHPKS